MGVLNVTPDSFSDGGRFLSVPAALAAARAMAAEGADIIDVGGESTRPGAPAVGEAEEADRVVPVIEALRHELDRVVSVDTGKAGVMRAAVAAGASMINDVYALQQPGALAAAAALGKPVCLAHMQGTPGTMQNDPEYADVVGEVTAFLRERAALCMAAGIPAGHIVIDPGFGFGKTLKHNLALMHALPAFGSLGYDVLVGVSRKSFIGLITGRAVQDRVYGSVGLAVYAALKGAAILRVHDVGATVDALRVVTAVEQGEPGG
jgi:dihydropteroate synthase